MFALMQTGFLDALHARKILRAFNGHLVIRVGDVDSENLKDVPAADADPISGEVEGEGGGGEPLHVEGKGADHGHRSVE